MSEAASNRDRDSAFEKVDDDNRAFLIQCGPIRLSSNRSRSKKVQIF